MAQDGNNSIDVLLKKGRLKKSISDNDFIKLESWEKRNTGYKDQSKEFVIKASDLGGADTNTWDITDTAFVDGISGDDLKGIVGDGNKPFKTINKAIEHSTNIIIKPSTLYYEYIYFKGFEYNIYIMPNTTLNTISFILSETNCKLNIFEPAGVKHIETKYQSTVHSGGYSELNVVGKADYINFDGIKNYNLSSWKVNFEFNNMYDTSLNSGEVLFASTNSEIIIKGRSINRIVRNGSGSLFNIRSNAKVDVYIDENITSNIRIFFFRNQGSLHFSGVSNIKAKTIETVFNSSFYPASYTNNIHVLSASSGEINVDCDLIQRIVPNTEALPQLGVLTFQIVSYGAIFNFTCKNAIIKDEYGASLIDDYYIIRTGNYTYENCKFLKSDLIKRSIAVGSTLGIIKNIKYLNCSFETDTTIQFEHNSISYFKDCIIKSTANDVFTFSTVSSKPLEIYFYNSIIRCESSSNLILNYDNTSDKVGMSNTIGSLPLTAGVIDEFAGYRQLNNIKI